MPIDIKTVHQGLGVLITGSGIITDVIIAVVADRDLSYGLARMADLMRGEQFWESAVFRERFAAEAWLRERVSERFNIEDIAFD